LSKPFVAYLILCASWQTVQNFLLSKTFRCDENVANAQQIEESPRGEQTGPVNTH
jgi:hypothetical protein